MVGNIIDACSSPSDWLASWQVLSALGILVSWFVLSLTYMVGSLLDNVGLMARAKAEVWEIITTTIILASVIVIASAACTFPASYVNPILGASTDNMFKVSENYLFWLGNKTMQVFADLMDMNNTISVLLSIMGGFNIFGIGLTMQPFAGLQPLMNIMNLFMNGAMICMITAVAQMTVLKFIEAGVLSVLLPAGIVCRSFPFTRQFGGSLIAIALGLYIFYPLMLVVDDAIMGSPSRDPRAGGIGYSGSSNTAAIIASVPFMMVGFFLGGASGAASMFSPTLDMVVTYFVNKPIVGLGEVALAAFILPAINGVVFVAVVRDLSRILGQEVDVSSLSRIV